MLRKRLPRKDEGLCFFEADSARMFRMTLGGIQNNVGISYSKGSIITEW